MDSQRPYFTPFESYEDSFQCGPRMPGCPPHPTSAFSDLHYHTGDYRSHDSLMSWTAEPFPNPGPYQVKHTSSDLYRIDSGLSLASRSLDHSTSSYTFSDRHASPFAMSPDIFGDFYEESFLPNCHNRTTSMSDVQNFADHFTEVIYLDPEQHMYPVPLDGYIPSDIAMAPSSTLSVRAPEMVTTIESPTLRSRRPPARATNHKLPISGKRVSKRTTPKRSSTFTTTSAVESEVDEDPTPPPRPFHCPLAPYGCESTFGSKNEWKRHFSTQHLRLEYWRCDDCPASHGKKPNDFNRRDLFTQHVRRMHTQKLAQTNRKSRAKPGKNDDFEQQISEAAARCHRLLRSPPTKSICVVCSQAFSGVTSWDERMEHLGRHFEACKKESAQSKWPLDVASWVADTDVEKWMITHGILSLERKLIGTMDDLKE